MKNYCDMALNREQKRLAKRLAALPEDDRLYDDELVALDNKNSRAALVVLACADELAEQEQER